MSIINFDNLSEILQSLNTVFSKQAKASVNICLTLRNWLFGLYIHEYQQHGKDRAAYGEFTLKQLSQQLKKTGVPSTSERNLALYRKFYQCYPEILQAASAKCGTLKNTTNQSDIILQTLSAKLAEPSTTGTSVEVPKIAGETLVATLSFSHFVELLQVDNPLKRRFYEVESMQNHLAVRELKRQIDSLYYERCGLSDDKEKLAQLMNQKIVASNADAIIKDPYVFEFLGLSSAQVMDENQLSHALLNKLQQFLLELGKGFCFEARQKRILIGDEYFFIDLVFYHRILKTSVLIELKMSAFNHENIGQLNTYLNYFKEHEMHPGDNPPIGILLCTKKNEALVKYAISDQNNKLFVSNYKLELPSEQEMKQFIENQLAKDLSYLVEEDKK